MTISKLLIVGIVGTGCLVASGIGGYWANRSVPSAQADTQATQAALTPSPNGPGPALGTISTAPGTPSPAQPLAVEASGRTAAAPDTGRVTAARPRPTPSPRVTNGAKNTAEPSDPLPATVVASATAVDPGTLPADIDATPVVLSEAPPDVAPDLREITVPANAVVGIRLERALSSETARVEDRVVARVTRDVRVDDITVIPSGARLEGTVTLVSRGGHLKDRARIGFQFTTLVVDDARLPIQTEAIYRDGEPQARESTTKIGASAVVGTILGAVIGGKKGAVIGGTAGAAGGTAAVMAADRNEVSLAEGSTLTVRLTEPVSVSVAREP